MKTKQEQIEQMAKERNEIKDIMKLLDKCVSLNPMCKSEVASVLYGNNYRKLPEDSVVLSREEYEMLKSSYDTQKGAIMTSSVGDLPLQEQIEEMAVIGCVRNPQAHTAEECAKCDFKQGQCNAYRHAEALYNAGYRKTFTSDFASDIQKAFKDGYEKGCETCEQAWDNGYNDGYGSGKEDGVREFAEELKAKTMCIKEYEDGTRILQTSNKLIDQSVNIFLTNS